jgi:hypothetical protein
MQPSVTAGADRDQQIRITVPRMPMVNMKEACLPCPAAPILKSAPDEDSFAVSAEVIPRVPAHPIALRAEPADRAIRL